MLGHSDPKMTLRYAHVSDRDVEAAAERIGKVIETAMETGPTARRLPRGRLAPPVTGTAPRPRACAAGLPLSTLC